MDEQFEFLPVNTFVVNHTLPLIFILLLPVPTLASEVTASMPTLLRTLEGRWVGTFEVANPDGETLARFPVEHRYWVEDRVLKGLATAEIAGKLVFSHSESFVRDHQLVSRVTSDEGLTTYSGLLRNGILTWTPVDGDAPPISETLVEKEGKRFLKIQYAQNTRDPDGNPVTLTFRGILSREE